MSDMSNQGTPDNTESQDTDWQKRYTDLQASFTKASQEAAELRQYRELVDALQGDDPEASAYAAEQLGLAFIEEENSSTTNTNPQSALEQRLERIENWLGSQNEQEALDKLQQEDAEYMDTALEGLETRLGRDLTRPEVELLVSNALVNRDDNGNPGIEAAIALYDEIDGSRQQQWARSKRVSTPAQGQEGTQMPDLDEGHSARVAAMIQRFNLNNQT